MHQIIKLWGCAIEIMRAYLHLQNLRFARHRRPQASTATMVEDGAEKGAGGCLHTLKQGLMNDWCNSD